MHSRERKEKIIFSAVSFLPKIVRFSANFGDVDRKRRDRKRKKTKGNFSSKKLLAKRNHKVVERERES